MGNVLFHFMKGKPELLKSINMSNGAILHTEHVNGKTDVERTDKWMDRGNTISPFAASIWLGYNYMLFFWTKHISYNQNLWINVTELSS